MGEKEAAVNKTDAVKYFSAKTIFYLTVFQHSCYTDREIIHRRIIVGIPKPTAERLSQLARLLEQRGKPGTPISSAEIEHLTGWPSHTIRKDISALAAESDISTNSGYDPRTLAKAIKQALGFSIETNKCCIVGLGRLGSAFLEYSGFQSSPFLLCAGFDSNVNRIEILKADFPLFPTFKMKEVISRLAIRYAILCVPPAQAQATADKLIECGVTGIANFTPSILSVPSGIEVENVSIIDALGSLAARLAAKRSLQ